MVDPSPDAARPTPEPWTEDRPRPNWAPFDLPNSAIKMIEGEQILQQLGVRDIVAGLASASVTDFQNGLEALKRVFVTQYEEGFDDGQHNALDDAGIRTLLGGVVVGAVGATLVWAVAWAFLS